MYIRRVLASAGALALASLGIFVLPAGQAAAEETNCSADRFCAYNHVSYGELVLDSNAPKGSRQVGVRRDVTSSGINRTSNQWVGVNIRKGLPDQQIFKWGPNSENADLGDPNRGGAGDRIDHFDVF